ncbi:MAG: DNA polymerase III subunit gamma/tau [Halieaceae bacterium]|nr:DNA polymerase III subunit gamma/tau [Halieaceae bacterium]
MSYQVLARKWRPRVFREMAGQEHVTRALINALDQDRLHHAYLFSGTRGVGKTTVARILAKCLNCETGVSSEPCGTCSSCREITEGRSMDLIEVDAASRTKVEDTRELLENVQYAPTHCRYKVYLIDEVHMLSTSSFNALLKTLEEPPPHVKFLLATTDPQKLPLTVLSRCLQFNLKNMAPELIVDRLQTILREEGVSCEEPALWLLARSADGSMRDALSLADQALAFGSGQLLEKDVRSMLGTVDFNFVHELLTAIVEQNPKTALEVVEKLAEHAPDFVGVLLELIALLHRVSVAQALPDAVDNRWGDAEQVLELARVMSAEEAQLYYQIALTGKRDIGLSSELRSGLEMTLLRMIAFRPSLVIDESLAGAELQPPVEEAADSVKKPEPASATALEAALPPDPEIAEPSSPELEKPPTPVPPETATPILARASAPDPSETAVMQPATESEQETAEPPEPASTESPNHGGAAFEPEQWPEFLEQLGLRGSLYQVASNTELRQVEGGNVYFLLDETSTALFREDFVEKIQHSLTGYLEKPVQVHLEIGAPGRETPARRTQRLLEQARRETIESMQHDPKVKLLLDHFEGTLDIDSIAPVKYRGER